MTYKDYTQQIDNISFDEIIKLNKSLIPEPYKTNPWHYPGLDHGTAILTQEEQCAAYIAAYGEMHQEKINEVLYKTNVSDFQNTDIQIIDWGCGQGLATSCLFDFFTDKGISLELVKKVVLIEPSELALERAQIHINAYLDNSDKIVPIQKVLDDVTKDEIKSSHPLAIHLFSNILDIPSIDLQQLSDKIKRGLSGKHYFFCWGPLNYGNSRIDLFWNYFSESKNVFTNVHGKQEYDNRGTLIKSYSYTAKNRVFTVDMDTTELVFIDYYLPKQFHAAYQLDAVRKVLRDENNIDKLHGLYQNLSEFEIQTPFDIGASIYEDVHPIFAVLNNIITRGLPTKASPFIEDQFATFGNKKVEDDLGAINYSIDGLKSDDLFMAMHLVDSRWKVSADNYNCKALDSDLEKEFITKATSPIIRQLMQPQRDLSTITNKNWHHSQRVDFAFEFPYPSKDINGNNRKGHVIELDGMKYHSGISQQLSDQQRINELVTSGWYCVRLTEDEINKPYQDYYHLGSEYVQLVEKAYSQKFDATWANTLQLVLSPIAVARIEKTIVEALMTGRLDINAKEWEVLAIEHDVPCVALAFEDLKTMFYHITQLSEEYSSLSFPEIKLTIISTEEFSNSALHLGNKTQSIGYMSNTEFDMVIDCAMLRRAGLEKVDFTQYRCKNKCYFNIRSAHYHRNERLIYTTDRIVYKPIVISNQQGRYDDIKENVEHLQYFLQLLFRKAEFRPGQTPILSRALQNKSVIGLLPTGGGKSLTYQIAAMLQPGVTLVVDPLRSLMKDQYDGLISAGIDSCTYITAIKAPKEITAKREIERYRTEERERRAKRMESSELQFVFLSPERLSILDFRERLKNMRDTGVYFSYGVIDEVHCVSEWGHDFRFSYLHLGRNLYQYVLPKQKSEEDNFSHITLFGLTATASFDVLADVERELSGNGAFPLDSDTIVRDGNTNRFELQYKIEPIPVKFKDKNGFLKPDKWAIFDAKKDYLDNLISEMPNYMNQLLSEESIETIKKGYGEESPRQDDNIKNVSLEVDIPNVMLYPSDSYNHGGIVFCPHKDNTGIAVFTNADELRKKHPETQIGTFVGSNDDSEDNDKKQTKHPDDNDEASFRYLELFRDNKIPLMIATKAFGMGIDKPNVRYTINMNYSSSLESFVQEAGRAGRDRKMALSTIMFSKYKIARVKPESEHYKKAKDKWFDGNDLQNLSENLNIPIPEIEVCDETSDLVKLKCKQCGDGCKRFEQNCCSYACQYAYTGNCLKHNENIKQSNYNPKEDNCLKACEFMNTCPLSNVPTEDRWAHYDHLKLYKDKYKFITTENYEFLNADYESVIYFHNSNFKGEMIEDWNWKKLLQGGNMIPIIGGETFISYSKEDYADIAKAIYRMCCIELVDDFTQDFNAKQFRIVSKRKVDGEYYAALERYFQRYYSQERARELIEDVRNYEGEDEIHKCMGFLTHFIYDKIAVKRKRAIDDMHAFCVHGIDENKDWKSVNEDLKDELYFYFNSKYARRGYRTQCGNEFSLVDDTNEGKVSTSEILFKYMQVVDEKWMNGYRDEESDEGIEGNSEPGTTQIDNARHLYGAVRLIRRQITDDNGTVYLLGAFCLMFLGTNGNAILEDELANMYIDGMKEFYKQTNPKDFWSGIFEKFNQNEFVAAYFRKNGTLLQSTAALEIHKEELRNINNKYTE